MRNHKSFHPQGSFPLLALSAFCPKLFKSCANGRGVEVVFLTIGVIETLADTDPMEDGLVILAEEPPQPEPAA